MKEQIEKLIADLDRSITRLSIEVMNKMKKREACEPEIVELYCTIQFKGELDIILKNNSDAH